MTRFAKYIYILTAPIAAAAILTACSSSDDAPDKGGSSLSEISLSVVFSGSEGSRAGENKWEVIDRPHDADAFETSIAPATIKVVVYESDGHGSYTHFETLSGPRIRALTYIDSDTYRLVAAFNKNIALPSEGTEIKVMVYANDDVEPGDPMALPAELKAIPMWGVTTARLMPGMTYQNIGDINMLRAYAKITLDLDPALQDSYTITAATVEGVNYAGHTRPKHYEGVEHTTDLIYAPATSPLYCFNPVSPAVSGSGVNFKKSQGEAPYYYAYAPETANSVTEPITLTIDITETDSGTSHTFTATADNDGSPLADLVRNHIYDYTITSININADDGLRFKATIRDMEKGGEYNYEY